MFVLGAGRASRARFTVDSHGPPLLSDVGVCRSLLQVEVQVDRDKVVQGFLGRESRKTARSPIANCVDRVNDQSDNLTFVIMEFRTPNRKKTEF